MHIRSYLDNLKTKNIMLQSISVGPVLSTNTETKAVSGKDLGLRCGMSTMYVAIYGFVGYISNPHVWEVLLNDYRTGQGGWKGLSFALENLVKDCMIAAHFGFSMSFLVNVIKETTRCAMDCICDVSIITQLIENLLSKNLICFGASFGVGVLASVLLRLVCYGFSYLYDKIIKRDEKYHKVFRGSLFSNCSLRSSLIQILMGSVASIFVTNPWVILLVVIAIPIIYYVGEKSIQSLWEKFQAWWSGKKPQPPTFWVGPDGKSAQECCPLFDYKVADNVFLSLICPITHELMLEPVEISCGHIFEAVAYAGGVFGGLNPPEPEKIVVEK